MGVDNATGIINLCSVALHLLDHQMPDNAATRFAVRTVLREAVNKSTPEYKGNNNRKNCQYASVAAISLIDDPNAELIAEHAMPISILLKEVYVKQFANVTVLVELVARYSTMVLITDAEDDRLCSKGLVKTMPLDWDGQDVLARYKVVGIEVMSFNKTV